MTSPRRTIVRSSLPSSPSSPRLELFRSRLREEHAVLQKWMRRLRRAFHAMEKQQRRVDRLVKQIAKLETMP